MIFNPLPTQGYPPPHLSHLSRWLLALLLSFSFDCLSSSVRYLVLLAPPLAPPFISVGLPMEEVVGEEQETSPSLTPEAWMRGGG